LREDITYCALGLRFDHGPWAENPVLLVGLAVRAIRLMILLLLLPLLLVLEISNAA